jgi:glyoxylate reductase
MTPRVFVTLQLPAAGLDLLRARYNVEVVEAEGMPEDEVVRRIKAFDPEGIIGMVNVPITDRIMGAAPRLRCIANYAVGYNNINLEAASRRGILVTNTPGVLTEATADLAFALLLAVARRVVESDRFLREGHFKGWKADLLLGSDVYGRVLGIIGFGRIGQAMARRALGFNMSVLYTDARRVDPGIESSLRAQFVPLDELLRKADYVTIHADLNAQTRHLIGERELRLMGPEHYLINAARGPIIDEEALVRALKEGWIKGAALDVYEAEPTLAAGLTECQNAVLLPHLGSATVTARAAMAETAARNLIAALEGETPPNLVNQQALAGRR